MNTQKAVGKMRVDRLPASCRYIKAGLASVIWLTVFSIPAHGQGLACGPREDILAALGTIAREQPEGRGLSQRGYILQLVTSDNARTFSLVAIYANGRACVVDAGHGWERVNKLDYPTFGDGL